jgi:hypothetical protein
MKKSKLEKVLEYMVNGESDLASEMLHEHIIESAREIYADLAEEDDAAEADLELDEDADEDLDEGYFDDNKSGDFEDDIETMSSEVETEEYFGEDDDDDLEGEMDDLEGEMDMDMADELGDEMGDEMGDVPAEADLEDAFVNVEDAMDELKAAFADIMGDDMGDDMADEPDMDDEVADTFGGEDDLDMDDEDDFEESFAMEDAKLNKATVKNVSDTGDKASPIRQNKPAISDHGKAVNFAGGSDEKGGKGDSAKKMSVTGPQEQKGKMDKKVAAPSNKSEKAKSNIGS